jgi:8-oxo-dGTP diphosphatase
MDESQYCRCLHTISDHDARTGHPPSCLRCGCPAYNPADADHCVRCGAPYDVTGACANRNVPGSYCQGGRGENPYTKKSEPGKHYVVGFAFTEDLLDVILIRKLRPDWQVGKLNGVGGRMDEEDRGDVRAAMVREFKEEVGIETQAQDWTPFSKIEDCRGWSVTFLSARLSYHLHRSYRQMTDEQPVLVATYKLASYRLIPNVHWLIPMALTMMDDNPLSKDTENASFFRIHENSEYVK